MDIHKVLNNLYPFSYYELPLNWPLRGDWLKFDILTGVPAMSVRHSAEVAKVGSGNIAFTVGYVRGSHWLCFMAIATHQLDFL